jgi:hypothetical protein
VDVGIDKAKLQQYKATVAKHLRDPVKLRLTVVAVLSAAAIAGIYLPLSSRIEQTQRQLTAERTRYQSLSDVEKLRSQVGAFRGRISEHSDTNEWVQYLLDGLREFQVKLRDMASKKLRPVGPYVAVTLSMEIEGTYPRLKGFVEWLESSERLLRVDSVRLEKRKEALLMKIAVVGLIQKNASAT